MKHEGFLQFSMCAALLVWLAGAGLGPAAVALTELPLPEATAVWGVAERDGVVAAAGNAGALFVRSIDAPTWRKMDVDSAIQFRAVAFTASGTLVAAGRRGSGNALEGVIVMAPAGSAVREVLRVSGSPVLELAT